MRDQETGVASKSESVLCQRPKASGGRAGPSRQLSRQVGTSHRNQNSAKRHSCVSSMFVNMSLESLAFHNCSLRSSRGVTLDEHVKVSISIYPETFG